MSKTHSVLFFCNKKGKKKMSKRCTNCNTDNNDGSTYCRACGAKLPQVVSDVKANGEQYSFFTDSSEQAIALLGRDGIKNYEQTMLVTSNFVVPSQLRVYFKGACYGSGLASIKGQMQEHTVDIKDITGISYELVPLLPQYAISIASLLPVMIAVGKNIGTSSISSLINIIKQQASSFSGLVFFYPRQALKQTLLLVWKQQGKLKRFTGEKRGAISIAKDEFNNKKASNFNRTARAKLGKCGAHDGKHHSIETILNFV